ncbi:monoacylglycerol lipase ABHD6-like [Eublepharis macularius]|uniref:acylglycerol lipase n=1 Tax=Eublepharis macularius TaxID=481883 RepID=A0AA97KYT6_EUBMA|nr:monoacylglycerol lipase ABHD6-like [Eublepharis macularius]
MMILMTASGAVAGLLITFATMYYWRPSEIIKLLIWFMFKKRGVKVKYVKHEGYKFSYFCQGKPGPQPSILMFHGFSLGKYMWLYIIQYFPKDVHVVCVDLPGHGETTRVPGESYTAVEQAKRMHQFVECSGLNRKPFHLVGISMGGMVAGVYAALYPSEVYCLSLLCPAGLRYPMDNDFVQRLKELEKSKDYDNIPLIPLTVNQSKEMLEMVTYHPPPNPNKQLLQGFLDYQKPHTKFFTKCFLDITSVESRYSLQDNINKITAPTQVIWGKHDKVLDPAGGEIFANAIPGCQVHMLDKCGHFIIIERPRKSTKLILEFHASVCDSKKKH